MIKGLQDVFPDQKPINRTFINTWQDPNVTDIVKKSGRKQLVLAALWTEVCLTMPAIQALGEGYEVFVRIMGVPKVEDSSLLWVCPRTKKTARSNTKAALATPAYWQAGPGCPSAGHLTRRRV